MALPVVQRGIDDHAACADAGAGDQAIQRAVRCHHSFPAGLVGDIEGNHAISLVQIDTHDVPRFASKDVGASGADARGGAGDECSLHAAQHGTMQPSRTNCVARLLTTLS